MADIKPTSFVLDHTPWSVSKANVAKQCPKRFYYQYVKKQKLAKKPYNWASKLGKAVHELLEYMLAGHTEEQSQALVDKKYTFTSVELEEYLSFIPNVKQFLAYFASYKQRHAIKETLFEKKLSVDIDGNPVRFFDNNRGFLRGVLDMSVLFAKKPDALILDHKTGKNHGIPYFKNAFNAYTLLLKATNPELQRIKIGINFLRDGDIDFMPGMLDARDIQQLMQTNIKFLNDATQMAHNFELVRPGPLCGWCDYRGICPAKADGANHEKSN